MQTIEALQEKHKKEIEQLQREMRIYELLPVKAISVQAVAKDYTFVNYERDYSSPPYSLVEARDIVKAYEPFILSAEHWKSGCLSVRPLEINKYAKEEHAQMDGESYTELLLESYGEQGQYRHAEIVFWAKIQEEMLKVSVKVEIPWKWWPTIQGIDRKNGIFIRRLLPKGLGEDQFRKWTSDLPSYRLSYYWADRFNWESWIECEIEKGENNDHHN